MKNTTIPLTLIAFIIGALLTIWGFSQLLWPEAIPWSNGNKHILLLLSCTTLIFVGSWLANKSSLLIGIIVAIGITIMADALWPLIITLLFIIASIVLGKYILSTFHLNQDQNQDNWLVNFLVGAGFYGTAIGLLAYYPVNYPGLYGTALILPLTLGWRLVLEQFRNLSTLAFVSNRFSPRDDALNTAIAVVALIHFIVALMPEVMFDALTLHLNVSSQLALNHQWNFDPSLYSMALIPMLGDWIFSIGYMLAGESAARLINLTFSYLLAWQVREIVLWAGGKNNGAKWAVLLFLSTPLTYTETSSLFVEAVWATFIIAGVMSVFRLISKQQKSQKRELLNSGLMLGYASAAKALTLAILPIFLLMLILNWRIWINKQLATSVIIGLFVFILIGSIPYCSAWFIAGNPVHPFFNEIFKSPFYTLTNFDNALFKSGVTWDLPYRIIFQSDKYLEASNGASGFQWLLLLPATLIMLLMQWNRRGLLIFLFAILSLSMIFHSQSYLRYVYPVLVLLSATIGIALSSASKQSTILKKVFYLAAIFTVLMNLIFFPSATWSYRNLPLNILFSDTARNQYLEKRMPIRRAVEFVNYINKENTPVAFFSQPFAAGLKANALYPNWYNQKFHEEIKQAKDTQEVTDVLRIYESNIILLDENWSTSEKRKIIEKGTDKIAAFGSINVRTIKEEYRYGKELIDNPELSGSRAWALSPDTKITDDNESFLVSVSTPVTQKIKVIGGIRYINEVTARCASTPTQGRAQINWYDEKMQFITSSIKVYNCSTDWQSYRQIVLAPRNATYAIAYGTSHTTIPITITRISLR